ncbi:transcription factor bHLH94 [Aegilops tauschii subsp. strangulata]|uniref:BHLH domain-containing protein n=3 Tax=Triticinae TaxID=1648030 RepID=A0A3B6QJ16_WHEAT|nr:transcription factor bHLH94 [Aegilops tauschii subsp. strangulata]XP_044420405.1 transcription factor bHLH94-like isoform X1 [Triticum aestivum]
MALVDALCASSVDNAALVYSTFNAAGFLFDNAAGFYDDTGIAGGPALALQAADRAPGLSAAGDVAPCLEKQATLSPAPPRRKRRRRARSCKSREETECQRMTHIAVERNRRRQMNEYLVVLRSLMPESYVQRGDQASIVGGAIDFVKELEQQLQSLEAQKRALAHQQQHKAGRDAAPLPTAMPARASTSGGIGNACVESTSNCSSSVTEADGAPDAPPFAGFFTYPQYVWRQSPRDATTLSADESRAGVADIEVTLVETHASLRVMAPRRPGQLLRMVAGLQALRLTVLHLNVTALDSLALYSLSLKVEEGCGLTTADDIAAAVHHVLCFIHAEAEAAPQQLLAPAQ